MSAEIAGIDVNRIITQAAPIKSNEAALVLNQELTHPEGGGLRLISRRLTERLGRSSHALEMLITDSASFRNIVELLNDDDDVFVRASQSLTSHLVHAQISGSIQPGTAVFMDGECFFKDQQARFAAVVKADSAEALRTQVKKDGTTVLEYLKDLLFAEGTRLLKIGFFILSPDVTDASTAQPDDFTVFIFDHMLTGDGRQDAAKYFYSAFLGCTPTKESPKQVRNIFEAAQKTIAKSPRMTNIEKIDASNMLKYYFKNKNRKIVNPHDLSRELFEQEDQEIFLGLCEKKGCRSNCENDTSLIKGNLRLHKIKMNVAGSEVTLSGSPEALKESVIFKDDPDDPSWLVIRVHGKISQP